MAESARANPLRAPASACRRAVVRGGIPGPHTAGRHPRLYANRRASAAAPRPDPRRADQHRLARAAPRCAPGVPNRAPFSWPPTPHRRSSGLVGGARHAAGLLHAHRRRRVRGLGYPRAPARGPGHHHELAGALRRAPPQQDGANGAAPAHPSRPGPVPVSCPPTGRACLARRALATPSAHAQKSLAQSKLMALEAKLAKLNRTMVRASRRRQRVCSYSFHSPRPLPARASADTPMRSRHAQYRRARR